MAYFFHALENHSLNFYGDEAANGRDIINTLDHYKRCGGSFGRIVIPSSESLERVERFTVRCFLSRTIMNPDHHIDLEPLPRARFEINANAYNWVKRQIDDYTNLRRGDLYIFDSKNSPELGLHFLPEKVMSALHDYDWIQHEEQIKEWLASWTNFCSRRRR